MVGNRSSFRLCAGLALWSCALSLPATAEERNQESGLPMPGKSFGGVFRAGPSIESPRLGSLKKGHRVTILQNVGNEMNGFDWIKIRFKGATGYQWGGVLCSQSKVKGIYQTCTEAGM